MNSELKNSNGCSLGDLVHQKQKRQRRIKHRELLNSSVEVRFTPNFNFYDVDFRKIKVLSDKDIYDIKIEPEGFILRKRGGTTGVNGHHASVKDLIIETYALIIHYDKRWKIIVMN